MQRNVRNLNNKEEDVTIIIVHLEIEIGKRASVLSVEVVDIKLENARKDLVLGLKIEEGKDHLEEIPEEKEAALVDQIALTQVRAILVIEKKINRKIKDPAVEANLILVVEEKIIKIKEVQVKVKIIIKKMTVKVKVRKTPNQDQNLM